MQTTYLLPHIYKKIGMVMFIMVTILGLYISITGLELDWLNRTVFAIIDGSIFSENKYFQFTKANLTITITGILFIISGLLTAFSKEKVEDEYISKLRWNAMVWAVVINYILLLFAFMFIYGTAFLTIMIYNLFTILLIFIIRFNYLLLKNKYHLKHDQ